VQRVRNMHNWDIAIRSTVPLNPNALASSSVAPAPSC